MRTILHSQNNFKVPDNFLFIFKNKTFPTTKSKSKKILQKLTIDRYKNYEYYSKTLYTLTNIYR